MDYSKEAERITQGVDKTKHPNVVSLAENVLFMADRLKETMKDIGEQPITVEYDNGGGQKGTRKNPIYEAYTSLFNQFNAGLKRLDDILADSNVSSSAQSKLAELRLIEGKRKAQ